MSSERRNVECSRRGFFAGAAVGVASLGAAARGGEKAGAPALVAITLDLEMARNFPRWEDTEWDYQKGNLTPAAKEYAANVSKRVHERGGLVHHFVVGQVFEQPSVDWLRELAQAGDPIGNHTYDHVNLLASDTKSLQFRFQRAPWLTRGKPVAELIRENIALTTEALRTRVGVEPRGFRTPGGFYDGLKDRPDLQQMLLDLGFRWVSSKYPAHAGIEDLHGTGRAPSAEAIDAIVAAQQAAQPFRYPTGLIEVPMSPISDIVAFRGGRWSLDHFIGAIERALDWVIENGKTFDFLSHPSCLGVVDPRMRTIDRICDLVEQSSGRAQIVSLDAIAERGASS